MKGYLLFLLFVTVVGFFYLTRDKSKDAEKLDNFHQQSFYDGPDLVSTGQRVTEWTAGQAMTLNQAKPIDANTSKFEFAKTSFVMEDDFALAA